MVLMLPTAGVGGGILSHLKDEKVETQRVHLTKVTEPERRRSPSQATGFWTPESLFPPHRTSFGVAYNQRESLTILKNESSECILIPPPNESSECILVHPS